MKTRRTVVSLFAMAVALLFVFQDSLTASAAGNTYTVYYDGDWFYEVGSQWTETGEHRELYYLQKDLIKDGDSIVVAHYEQGHELKFNVHLSNLTVLHNSAAVVFANGIDECYLLAGSVAAVNGKVAHAYIYDNAVATFNSDVGIMEIIGTDKELFATVSVPSNVSVDRLIGRDSQGTYYDYSDIADGALYIKEGTPDIGDGSYRITPASAGSPATTAAAKAPATKKPAAGEYDDVPKTGESTAVYWLLGIAVVCLAGRFALRKAA